MRIGLALALALTLTPALAPKAAAQNLLTNPDFDVDVSDWEDPFSSAFVSFVFDTRDVDDSPSSGSLALTTTIDNGGASGVSQCVTLTADGESWAEPKTLAGAEEPKAADENGPERPSGFRMEPPDPLRPARLRGRSRPKSAHSEQAQQTQAGVEVAPDGHHERGRRHGDQHDGVPERARVAQAAVGALV